MAIGVLPDGGERFTLSKAAIKWGLRVANVWIVMLVMALAVGSCPANAQKQDATPSEPLLQGRERAAQDNDRKADQPITARIALRLAAKPSGLLPGAPKSEIEVLTRLKSGEEILIDRVPGDAVSSMARIVDDEGLTVGFFRTWSSKEDIWNAARGSFQIYFVGAQSIFVRTGEMRCQKTSNQGSPSISFHNGRWFGDARTLSFNVRATCDHIDYFDGAGIRKMIMLTGRPYDGKQGSWTEESARLLVAFDVSGEVVSADLVKGDFAKYREMAKCKAFAKTGTSLTVCGPDGNGQRHAFWRHQEQSVDYEFECATDASVENIVIAQGTGFFAASCGMKQGDKGRQAWLDLVSSAAPRGNMFALRCAECETLLVSRLHYSPGRRELSFNLETDAKQVEFEGGKFEIPAPLTNAGDGAKISKLPVFTIRMNEQWQLVEISSAFGTAAQQ